MSMDQTHAYIDEKGVPWERVWSAPAAKVDSFNENDAQSFVRKTGAMKGATIGDLQDEAAALSAKRVEKEGVDRIKEQKYADYAKKNGKQSLHQIKEQSSKPIVI